jgi:hypothetical protein
LQLGRQERFTLVDCFSKHFGLSVSWDGKKLKHHPGNQEALALDSIN